jgi:hypothetical protein
MSIQSIQSSIQRLNNDLSSLQSKLADANKKEADKNGRLVQLQQGISRTSSMSSLESKMREIARIQDDIARIQRDKASITKNIADKSKSLSRYQQDLYREEERERQRAVEAEKRRQRQFEENQRNILQELRTYHTPDGLTATSNAAQMAERRYDLFISHASEDKEDFVRPLAEELTMLGISVWYDEFQLRVGDSLRRSIDRGLASSRFGVVVLSSSFFQKNWPQYELDGMVAREMNGTKVILPIWHRVTKNEVMNYSPSLADKVALNSSILSIGEIAQELVRVLRD